MSQKAWADQREEVERREHFREKREAAEKAKSDRLAKALQAIDRAGDALVRYDAIRAAWARWMRAEGEYTGMMSRLTVDGMHKARQAFYVLMDEALILDGDPTQPKPTGTIEAK